MQEFTARNKTRTARHKKVATTSPKIINNQKSL
jgi:hypothetical protein